MNPREYYLQEFKLIIHPEAYLVHVQLLSEGAPRQDFVHDLPDWVFHSHLTIWLLDEDSSLYKRALRGEQIKNRLISYMLPTLRDAG